MAEQNGYQIQYHTKMVDNILLCSTESHFAVQR